MGKKFTHHAVEYLSARGDHSTRVILFAKTFRHDGIDDHVGRTGVESENIFWPRIRRDYGEIPDTAKVLQNAIPRRMMERNVIQQWHQRRTLAADSKIGGTEIRNNRNAEPALQ